MKQKSTSEKVLLGGIVALMGLVFIALVISISVGIFACFAMLLMNVIMPLFDVEYPLTWLQAFGVGGAVLIIKSAFGIVVHK